MEKKKLTRQELEKWSKTKLIDYLLKEIKKEKLLWKEMLHSFNPKVQKDENNNLVDDSLIVRKHMETEANWGNSLAIPREANIGQGIVNVIKKKKPVKGGKKHGK